MSIQFRHSLLISHTDRNEEGTASPNKNRSMQHHTADSFVGRRHYYRSGSQLQHIHCIYLCACLLLHDKHRIALKFCKNVLGEDR